MSKPTQGERIAVLEHRVTEVALGQSDMKKVLESVVTQQQQILQEFAKYRGTWGGVVLVAGAIYALWNIGKEHLLALFSRGG